MWFMARDVGLLASGAHDSATLTAPYFAQDVLFSELDSRVLEC